ncbi:MAG: GTPase Era [bacterium]
MTENNKSNDVIDSFFGRGDVSADGEHKAGYVALIGRPNVGKSTLMNHLLGQKLSIVASRPQTTRHRIAGIVSREDGQIVYVDTPGIHLGAKSALNVHLNRVASAVLQDVDLILFIIEGDRWTSEDENVLNRLKETSIPCIAVVNKIDLIPDKGKLLPIIESLEEKYPFELLIPISASKESGLDELEQEVMKRLPFSRPIYSEDQLTDRSEKFIASEFIREQLTRRLHHELPYGLTVEIDSFKQEKTLLRMSAVIWVDRASHKKIVIGKKGQMLKDVGQSSRKQLEVLLDQKVFMQLWVKVREGWADDARALQKFGYTD